MVSLVCMEIISSPIQELTSDFQPALCSGFILLSVCYISSSHLPSVLWEKKEEKAFSLINCSYFMCF